MKKEELKVEALKTSCSISKIFLDCDCGSEVMQVEKDPAFNEFFVSIYTRHPQMTLWNKFRHIWQVLRTGEPFADQIIINEEEAQRLAEFLRRRNDP